MRRSGVFLAIVGPSGAGKDSLIRGLQERLTACDGVIVARRVVTRPSDAHEDHSSLDEAAFADAERAGRFALTWSAHGLRYGVPAEIDAAIAQGKIVVCNVSRSAIAALRRRYEEPRVVLVTAPAEVLSARLAARGREGTTDRRARLRRADLREVDVEPDVILDNSGRLDKGVDRLYCFVRACRVSSPE